MTSGLLSRVLERDGLTFIQTDAAVSGGNSGGPVFDECGMVVGVVVTKIVREDVEGIGFAVSERDVRASLPKLRTAGNRAAAPGTPTTVAVDTSPAVAWLAERFEQVYAFVDELMATVEAMGNGTLDLSSSAVGLSALSQRAEAYGLELREPRFELTGYPLVCEQARFSISMTASYAHLAAGWLVLAIANGDPSDTESAREAAAKMWAYQTAAESNLDACAAASG